MAASKSLCIRLANALRETDATERTVLSVADVLASDSERFDLARFVAASTPPHGGAAAAQRGAGE
jgi:hypothetical protein